MSLEQKDLEVIERIFYKWSDDVASNMDRNFERVHERLDDTETRLYMRIGDVEDRIDGTSRGTSDMFETVREEIREITSKY